MKLGLRLEPNLQVRDGNVVHEALAQRLAPAGPSPTPDSVHTALSSCIMICDDGSAPTAAQCTGYASAPMYVPICAARSNSGLYSSSFCSSPHGQRQWEGLYSPPPMMVADTAVGATAAVLSGAANPHANLTHSRAPLTCFHESASCRLSMCSI